MANKQTEHEREHRGIYKVPILGGLINRIEQQAREKQEEQQREREREARANLAGELGTHEWGNNLYGRYGHGRER